MAENRELDISQVEDGEHRTYTASLPGTILGMKLYRPPLPHGHIPRLHLLKKLNSSPCHLFVISAPAGFGKSTLAIEYLQQLPGDHKTSWLSLDERDNNLQRFLTYIVHAFSRCLEEGAGDASLQQLEVHQAHQPLSFESVLSPLLDELAQLTDPITVVLDDYHVINRESVHQCMQFLFHHLPAGINLVLTSRYQLGVALAKLHLNRQLEELNHQDLCFNHQEITSFLLSEGFTNLSANDVRVLEERSEGWIAGLRLFTMAVLRSEDPSQYIFALKGSEQLIATYLLEEVFARLPAEVQKFLLDTAILDSFNAELCDEVRESDDSFTLLGQLQRKGVFLVPLNNENTWYRYHHLFSEFLEGQSSKLGGQHSKLVYGRASNWFYEQGQMQQAVDYALRANDLDGASRLVQSLSEEELIAEQNLSQILSWRSELPETLITDRPRLVVVYSWALALSYQFAEAERLVANLLKLEEAQGPFYQGHEQAIQAVIKRGRSELVESEQCALQALKLLPEDSFGARILCLSTLSNISLSRGNLDAARQYNRQSVEEAQRSGNDQFELLTCFDHATIQFARGHLNVALRHVDEYIKRLPQSAGTTSMGRLYMFKALGLWQQHDLDGAECLARRGIKIAEESRDVAVVLGYTVRIMVYRNRRDVGAAFNMLAEVERLMNLWDIPQAFYLAWLTALKCDLWIYQGKLELARSWLERLQAQYKNGKAWPPMYFHFLPGLISLVYSRLLIVDGNPEQGVQVAKKAGGHSRQLRSPLYHGVALVYEASALEAAKQHRMAELRLEEAIALLEKEQVLFPFLELSDLVSEILKRINKTEFAIQIIQMLSPEGSNASDDDRLLELNRQISEPISRREMSVLILITQGLSNQQIADKLFISLHTVKTHARRINNKLEVRSRTQAAARARELGLV